MKKTVLLTGCAGFIGAATTKKLLDRGDAVIGIDNLNDYYDVSLKKARLALITDHPNFNFYHADIKECETLFSIVKKHQPQTIINLAASGF